jgi:hypothetical protein
MIDLVGADQITRPSLAGAFLRAWRRVAAATPSSGDSQ